MIVFCIKERNKTQEELYDINYYSMFFFWNKNGPINFASKLKCIEYIEKWTVRVIFLYNLYSFVWMQHNGYNKV